MKNNLILGRRVLKNGLVIATTFVTCAALHAEDPSASAQVDINTPSSAQGAGQSSQKGQSNQQVEKFVQKAMASGQMEVQMGQLGQTQAQNPQVKALADALVRDHTQANQKLQQIASSKNITQDKSGHGDHQKHQQHLGKLKQQTGAEFDKEFVRMALKHHKKDIQEFEKAQTQLNDSELKSFVSETLPKLRQHQQMAQAAAKTVGVDEASITAEIDADSDSSAVGGAAQAESGPREKSPILQRESSTPQSSDRPRSSIDGATESDPSGTINQNNPSISADAQIGDRDLSAEADVDVDDAAVDADVDTDSDNKVFEKGDGKVLGLSTDKNDGKFLGIIPNPRKDKDVDADASIEADADVDVDADEASVGGSASVEKGSKSDE
jgi:putative membrane protein